VFKTDMRYLAKAGAWNNLDLIVSSIFSLALYSILARILPQEVYGNYQYFVSLASLVTATCLTGMNGAVTQSVARGNEGDLRASIIVQLKWNIVPFLLASGGAMYYFMNGNHLLAIGLEFIAMLAPLSNTYNTYSAFLRGKRDFKATFLYNLGYNILYYSVLTTVALTFPSALALISVNMLVSAAAMFLLYRRTVRSFKPNQTTDRSAISYGKHLSLMDAFGSLIAQTDSLLVFHFLGPIQLAIYSLTTLIPERAGGFLNFIGTAALPKLANRTREEVRSTILGKVLRVAIAGVVITTLYVFLAPPFFRIFFPKYIDAIPYTLLYSPAILLLAVSNFSYSAMLAQRLQNELYATKFIYPAVLILLQITLITRYGLIGMIAARLTADTINIGLSLFFLKRRKESAQ